MRTIVAALCLTFLSGCENNDLPQSDLVSGACTEIIIADENDTFPTDEVTIKKAVITSNILTLDVVYGGGCGTTEFKLFGSDFFMESLPVQTGIALSFKDDDLCKAIIEKQLCFDLSELARVYKTGYQTQSGTIILHLGGYSPSLRYSF